MNEVWYVVQWSYTGADDWFSSGIDTYSSAASARKAIHPTEGFDHRVVKKSVIEEVVAE